MLTGLRVFRQHSIVGPNLCHDDSLWAVEGRGAPADHQVYWTFLKAEWLRKRSGMRQDGLLNVDADSQIRIYRDLMLLQ